MAKPTVSAVAEHAGVSVASVSRVLNGLPARPEMVERVRKSVAELGYVPDAAARSLKARRTHQICLSVADLGNPVYVAMTRGVERAAAEQGYRLVLSAIGLDSDRAVEQVDALKDGSADGLIISPLRITDELVEALESSPLPVVVIGSLPEKVEIDNVRVDSARGIELAAEHLAAEGRKRIAFLNGPRDTVPGSSRHEGFLRAMDSLRLSPAGVWEAEDFVAQAGYDVMRGVSPKFDALVCANDLLAVGAMKALGEQGLRSPDDVAITGMDNTELGAFWTPTLTSIDLMAEERGALAAEMLLSRLGDPKRECQRLTVAPQLNLRESSKGVRAN